MKKKKNKNNSNSNTQQQTTHNNKQPQTTTTTTTTTATTSTSSTSTSTSTTRTSTPQSSLARNFPPTSQCPFPATICILIHTPTMHSAPQYGAASKPQGIAGVRSSTILLNVDGVEVVGKV